MQVDQNTRSVPPVARMLRISKQALYQRIAMGKVKAIRPWPRCVRIPLDEVRRLLVEAGIEGGLFDSVSR